MNQSHNLAGVDVEEVLENCAVSMNESFSSQKFLWFNDWAIILFDIKWILLIMCSRWFSCCCWRRKNSFYLESVQARHYRCSDLFLIFLWSFLCVDFSEVEQSIAGLISDRATDEVLEALTRYKRGMGIPDSPNTTLNDSLAPDIVRSRSSHVSSTTSTNDDVSY